MSVSEGAVEVNPPPAPMTNAGRNAGRLRVVFLLTGTYLLAEVVGGIITGSLALLADAGHMFTDVAGVGLALYSIRLAQRPPTMARSYGYYRAEILAALANASVLIVVSLYILWEACKRFLEPPAVESGAMLVVAAIGLVVNLIGMWLLKGASSESLNMKGAYYEVLSDMLTSLGVIAASVIMLTTGWYYADPLVSAGIGLLILPRTWRLLQEAVGVLLEGTPTDVDVSALRVALASVPGVVAVHDLHVWSLTSGTNAMSVHLAHIADAAPASLLRDVHARVREFNVQHSTVQLELPATDEKGTHA
jgi:cobalt-zinc-cadmium efflux system protein